MLKLSCKECLSLNTYTDCAKLPPSDDYTWHLTGSRIQLFKLLIRALLGLNWHVLVGECLQGSGLIIASTLWLLTPAHSFWFFTARPWLHPSLNPRIQEIPSSEPHLRMCHITKGEKIRAWFRAGLGWGWRVVCWFIWRQTAEAHASRCALLKTSSTPLCLHALKELYAKVSLSEFQTYIFCFLCSE